jgi:hypothetical protein
VRRSDRLPFVPFCPYREHRDPSTGGEYTTTPGSLIGNQHSLASYFGPCANGCAERDPDSTF